ncbi:MAG TPA: hypothetical protein GX400_22715 [Chloroflexi bacterium]|nr:hypothetical protein [Chloroflexota bacterium]
MTTTPSPTSSPPSVPPGCLSWLRRHLPEVLILTLAAVTRFWQLDYHSFWFDEAVSLDWAEDGPDFIWQSTFPLLKDKHPPGYYLLLHVWQNFLDFFGLAHNDVALRALGALLGVLTVLALLLLARRLSGRSTARLTGLLAALAPALVWYSQELRMFQPATTGLVWGAYCLLRGWQGEHRWARLGWWLGMIGALTFALYSYLFSALALPAAGLSLLGLWVNAKLEAGDWRLGLPTHPGVHPSTKPTSTQSPISNLPISNLPISNLPISQSPNPSTSQSLNLRLVEGVLALCLTGLIFLPLARNAWLVNAGEGTPGQAFMDFGENLQRQLRIFTIWRAPWPTEVVTAVIVLFAMLVVIGLLWPWPQRMNRTAPGVGLDQLWLLWWIGAPLLIGNLLLATSDTVFKEDRYFLFLAPFVLWAAARGSVALGAWWRPAGWGRLAGWGLGGVAALLLAAALPVLWSPAMLREDWRAAARYIADYQQTSPPLPGAIFSHADYTHKALKWYLRPLADDTVAPLYFPYSGVLTGDAGEQIVAPPVRGLEAAGVATLWLVQSHLDGVDDARVVQNWIGANYPVITEQYPTGIEITGYALQHRFAALPVLGSNAVKLDAELAPNLRLLACEIMTPMLAATDTRLHPPSGWVHVRLWWQAAGAIAQDYFPSVQLVGPEGVWGERLYRDGEVLRRDPPTQWPAGVIVRDEVDVNLNPVTPSGVYPIVVGLRDGAGVDVGARVECGRVVIE